MGRKLGRGGSGPLFGGGELGPHLAQCGLNQGPPLCQVPSWSIQPFGHNGHRLKIGEGAPPPFWGGELGLHLTQSPGSRPTSIPSGILIHPAIWPQQIWTENCGAVPLWGRGAGSPLQCGQGRDLPHAKFHLDPSNRLATIHQRHRQTNRQADGQDSTCQTGQTTV